MTSADPETAGDVAHAFIALDLESERALKDSLEGRGLAVITSSGVLVTLFLGLGAIVTESTSFELAEGVSELLIVAAALFVIAAALGIACNSPRGYLHTDPATLFVFTEPTVWGEGGSDAKRELTAARLVELQDARARNQEKARLLVVAVSIQVLAVFLTAVAMGTVLARS